MTAKLPAKPFAGLTIHHEVWSAHTAADAVRSSDPATAAKLDELAAIPVSFWQGGWEAHPDTKIDAVFDRCAPGEIPVITLYNIPVRDGDNYSAGGAPNGPAYTAWIGLAAAGHQGRQSITILEPDAVAMIPSLVASGKLTASGKTERVTLIAAAVTTLKAAGAKVYIDAGGPNWTTAAVMAPLLLEAGVANAAGVAINVARFKTLADCHAYAAELHALLGTAMHGYVIDTGRNGLGPVVLAAGQDHRDEWCNPAGRGCGRRPTLAPKTALCDALLWVKPPGQSDGLWPVDAHGVPLMPAPGVFDTPTAVGLHDRAVPRF